MLQIVGFASKDKVVVSIEQQKLVPDCVREREATVSGFNELQLVKLFRRLTNAR